MISVLFTRTARAWGSALLILGLMTGGTPAQARYISPDIPWIQDNVHTAQLMAYANDNSILMSFLENQQQPMFAQVYGLYSNTPTQDYQIKINTLNLAAGQRWDNSATDTHWTLFLKLAPIRSMYFTRGSDSLTQYTESIGAGAFVRQNFIDDWVGYALLSLDYQIHQKESNQIQDYPNAQQDGWAKGLTLQGGRAFDFYRGNITLTPMLSYQVSQNDGNGREGLLSRFGPLFKMNWQFNKGFVLNADVGYNQVFYPHSYREQPEADPAMSTYSELFARLNLNMFLSARMRMTLHAGYSHAFGYGIDTYSLAVSQIFDW